jgi:hypothetical protein
VWFFFFAGASPVPVGIQIYGPGPTRPP